MRAPSINRTCALKFAVAPHSAYPMASSISDSGLSRRPSSPFTRERRVQRAVDLEESESEEEGISAESEEELPGYHRAVQAEASDDTDGGYEEDEEDGMFDDDEDYAAEIPRGPSPSDFPFARPTNYRRKRNHAAIPSTAGSVAPAAFEPPLRRGRGHIKVNEPPEFTRKACSKHCSPPPRSRSSSNAHEMLEGLRGHRVKSSSPRISDAGPRYGRAGSPMPDRVSDVDTDEDEEEVQPSPPRVRGGWRSDDAVFKNARTPRHVSAPVTMPVFDDEDEVSSMTDGVRDFLRRASEHLPGFRRPSQVATVSPGGKASPVVAQTICPPALDATPIIASSISRHEGEPSGGLAHRLEKVLSSGIQPGASIARAKSLSSKVSFQASNAAVRRDHSPAGMAASRIAMSADEGVRPIRCPVRNAVNGEELGWTAEALLAVRRNVGNGDV
jgi:hypothetical protein